MKSISVEATIQSTLETVWEMWTNPVHIRNWNHASPDWECPHAQNDVSVGGRFVFTMAAKDGSTQFDFNGTYTEVTYPTSLAYTIEGGRTVSVGFMKDGDNVHVVETFELEAINSEALQRSGWQAILDNFKHYVEKQ
jgi:uncharacterized protein YndB with AHSA1/START domain